jgi:hypothetical protein
MRQISNFTNPYKVSDYVTVSYESEFEEYSCRLFLNGVKQSNATYYTDDRQDAIQTAHAMIDNVVVKAQERAWKASNCLG